MRLADGAVLCFPACFNSKIVTYNVSLSQKVPIINAAFGYRYSTALKALSGHGYKLIEQYTP
jgi:hypothetical protein